MNKKYYAKACSHTKAIRLVFGSSGQIFTSKMVKENPAEVIAFLNEWVEEARDERASIITDNDFVLEIIDAEKEKRIVREEVFKPAFDEGKTCYFFWIKDN